MIECKANCPLAPQCLYHLTQEVMLEIEKARKAGQGNGAIINTYFAELIGWGVFFHVDIYPSTTDSKQIEVYRYSQRRGNLNDGIISFQVDLVRDSKVSSSESHFFSLFT